MITDPGEIAAFVRKAVEENPEAARQLAAGNQKAAQVLMGAVMTIGIILSQSVTTSESIRIEEPPLKIEDLMDVSYDNYITLTDPNASLLMSRLEVNQRHHFDDEPSTDIPCLQYKLYRVNVPALYSFFEKQMKRTVLLGYDRGRLDALDEDVFGAVNAYRVVLDGRDMNRYVLCYPDTLVDIETNWSLTEGEMEIIGEKLMGINQ